MLKQEDRSDAVVEILCRRGIVDRADLDRARRAAAAEGIRVDLALARLGLAPDTALARSYAEALGHPLFRPEDAPSVPVEGADFPLSYLERARVLPLRVDDDGTLHVAMADPLDAAEIKAIALKAGRPVAPRAARPADLEAALKRFQPTDGPARTTEADVTDVARLRTIASDAPVIRLVDGMLAAAVERRASDIHLLPMRGGLRVRFRIDGHLVDDRPPPPALRSAIVSRLKLMACLDIAETRLPQDGRIRLVIRGRELDLRVSVAPTVDGESVVIRILDGGGERPELARLGLSAPVLARIEELIDRPHGVTVVTGPTGSGKTTTLYAALRRMSRPDRHVATIEDPVEYRLEGVNQIQVRPEIGFDFPTALRHLLRHDPDVVMIGEIRDGETARIGLQSALTGHPVLATLHTNDAPSALPRLVDMGAEPFLVAAVLNGVVAQRLLRRLCPECRRPATVPEAISAAAARDGVTLERANEPSGCLACGGTGYAGRTAIAEVMTTDEALRRLLRDGADVDAIRAAALGSGMRTLRAEALALVAAGETSLDEAIQVVGRLA